VSISRRGLLAAGLAVAAVGAIGVASTMNAGAAETPAAAASDAAVAPEPVPPALLPWGDVPKPIKTGEFGASSEDLADAGQSAAANDQSDSTVEGVTQYGPKGEGRRSGVLMSSETDVPPLPPSKAEPVNGVGQVNYLYALGKQTASVDGVAASLTVAKPTLATTDWHSLAEIAVQSADGKQVVEVGWNVDRKTNGDEDTHLFVYHWVNGKSTCYNGCGFVPYSGATVAPGATLAVDVSKPFGIQYSNGSWWIAYDSEWIGSFPASLWGGTFTKGGLVQVFGEVAASSTQPCTQMGNGKKPDDSTAARIGSVTYVNGPTVQLTVAPTTNVYTTNQLTDRTFRYGGPGAC